jgi:hypothetical protein
LGATERERLGEVLHSHFTAGPYQWADTIKVCALDLRTGSENCSASTTATSNCSGE